MEITLDMLFDGALGADEGVSPITAIQSAKAKKQERYRALSRGINVQSYSNFGIMEECERKFAKHKLDTATRHAATDLQDAPATNNIHFAYGRAFESGIQATLMDKSTTQIFWDMFLAWDMPLDATDGKGKDFTACVIAIDNFQLIKDALFGEWELAYFHDKPAVELAFLVDMENGYIFVGHVDMVLRNKFTGQFRVIELKTTGGTLHEAKYANSPQATGYSIVVDEIAKAYDQSLTDIAESYSVQYLVYHSKENQFHPYDFTKSRSERAQWINTLMLDYQRLHMMREISFFPKRGSSCMSFNRPCQYFNTCDIDIQTMSERFAVVPMEELDTYEFDFRFKLSDIIQTQEELIS